MGKVNWKMCGLSPALLLNSSNYKSVSRMCALGLKVKGLCQLSVGLGVTVHFEIPAYLSAYWYDGFPR